MGTFSQTNGKMNMQYYFENTYFLNLSIYKLNMWIKTALE